MKKELINKLGLNCLIDENKTGLSVKEKFKVIEKLNQTYSYAQISEITGIPKSTISTWAMRGKQTQPVSRPIDIQKLIEYFSEYKPDLSEWGDIEKLRDTLTELLGK